MIRENEVSEVICSEIPILAIDLSQISEKKLYNVINCLTDHTKEMIREHRTSEVAQCFRTAYELLHEGTSLVKLAMVSIYINSVSRLLEASFCPEQCVKADFLAKFGKEYYQLIYAKN